MWQGFLLAIDACAPSSLPFANVGFPRKIPGLTKDAMARDDGEPQPRPKGIVVDGSCWIVDTAEMKPFEIRKADPSEIEAVTRMWRRSRDAVQPELEARMGYSAADDRNFFRNVLMKTCAVWLIIRNAQPAGFLALEDDSIEQLYVDPVEQGHGLGSALIEFAKRRSPQRLELHTHVSNVNARRFYEHRGFRATEFGTSAPPESEPDVKYVWSSE